MTALAPAILKAIEDAVYGATSVEPPSVHVSVVCDPATLVDLLADSGIEIRADGCQHSGSISQGADSRRWFCDQCGHELSHIALNARGVL